MNARTAPFGACPDTRNASLANGTPGGCPIHDVMHGISGKWVAFVLKALAEGPRRFGELRRSLPSITQRMLTHTLRDLQRDGLVLRTVLPTNPPSVEYTLTPLGDSLFQALRSILQWTELNHDAVQSARAAFDKTA
jgi:DNA-binding HxlR family transcriptional regulator